MKRTKELIFIISLLLVSVMSYAQSRTVYVNSAQEYRKRVAREKAEKKRLETVSKMTNKTTVLVNGKPLQTNTNTNTSTNTYTNGFTNANTTQNSTKKSEETGSWHYESKTCLHCKGSAVCFACKGSGKSVQTIVTTNIHKTCKYCHGRGICSYCKNGVRKFKVPDRKNSSGTSSSSSMSSSASPQTIKKGEINPNCVECHGSGNCCQCYGKGYTLFGGEKSQCAICQGRGKCVTCYGSKAYTFPIKFSR